MSIALIAHTGAVTSDNNNVTTGSINTSGADLLVAYVAEVESTADATLSDSKGNTWLTDITPRSDAATANMMGRMFYAKGSGITVGSGHTFTVTSSSGKPAVVVAAFSGSHLTTPLDQQNGTVDIDAGLSNTTGSITPSEDNCLVITGLAFDPNTATVSIDGSYTILDQVGPSSGVAKGAALAYAIQTSAAASNRTWSYTANEYVMTSIASFKAAAGGGGGGGTPSAALTLLLGS